MSVVTLEKLREFLQIEREYNNAFKTGTNLNRIKFIEIVIYKFFKIIDFADSDLIIAITLVNFLNKVMNQAKEVIYSISKKEEPVQKKKSFFDDYDKAEDEKYGMKINEESEYYDTLNKYIISIERYCRRKRIDINKRIDFLMQDVSDEMKYDEEHKDDFK